MNKKVIQYTLDTKDIDRAIREIEQYKQEIKAKVEECRKRIADAIAKDAQINFNSAQIEDIIPSGTRRPDVSVSVNERGAMTVIVADGADAVWCEFGAGVYHNGAAGSSPHPVGNDLGFTIGSYGKGYGKKSAWGYYDETGALIITRGTRASMPLYNAAQAVARKALDIAREVFG